MDIIIAIILVVMLAMIIGRLDTIAKNQGVIIDALFAIEKNRDPSFTARRTK